MITDEEIVEMFFERSEQAIRELDNKYGKICYALSHNIVGNRQDAEECVSLIHYRHISVKLFGTFP